MSEDEIQKRSIKPLAKIIAFAQSGVEPEIMGMGPVSAVKEVVSSKTRKISFISYRFLMLGCQSSILK